MSSAVTIPGNARFGRAELTLEASATSPATAVFTGLVVADSTRRPVSGAEVSLPTLGRRALTNDAGAFHFSDVPSGMHRVTVRHIGHGAIETELFFPPAAIVDRRIVLSRAVLLDSMLVTERRVDRAMASFEDHRRTGLGHFLDRDALSKIENRTTAAVLAQIPGLMAVTGRTRNSWIVSGRSGSRLVKADSADVKMGAPKVACYAQVYLDHVRIYSGRDEEPLFDVNSIAPDQIEAIEYYAGPAQTPPEYAQLNSTCGVLVIWTRRSY